MSGFTRHTVESQSAAQQVSCLRLSTNGPSGALFITNQFVGQPKAGDGPIFPVEYLPH